MTRQPPASFADRLAVARRLIARGATRQLVQIADQLDAATRETRLFHDRLGAILPVIEPQRRWQHRTDREPSDETRAHLLAALMGCTAVCVHIRRGGPRPAIARLPMRRVDCERCVQTLHRSVVGEDECDVCDARGVVFHPFGVRIGPALIAGDACPSCATVLGIRQEVSA